MKSYILLLALSLFSSFSRADEWTPDCEQQSFCKTNGSLEVCAINKGLTYQRLRIIYRGYLIDEQKSNINVYVNLNGSDGFFAMTVSDEKAEIELNKTRSYLCRTTQGIRYPECQHTKGSGKIVYEVEDNPQQALFKNTFTPNGWPKTWSVEIAINANDQWDSNYGSNYKFVFD